MISLLSTSKSVHLTPLIVEYDKEANAPLYDLIIGKQSLHDIGAVLDFKEKTIIIDSILLPMRNILNLQLKPSITRALRHKPVKRKSQLALVVTPKGSLKYWTLNMTRQIYQPLFETIVLTYSHHIERSCSHCYSNMRCSLMGYFRRLEPATRFYRIKGRGHAISWQAVPHSTNT